VVYDEKGRHYPVHESRLPVELPEMADYHPIVSEEPMPLLGKATAWVETTAGEAGVDPALLAPDTPVRRETNTMPGWAGSCWYYLRFCDPHDGERFVSRAAERYWMTDDAGGAGPTDGGVNLYIGGAEHAVLHLLYARFWHKILFDFGEVSTPEPMTRLFHQGMITSYAYQRGDRSLVPTDAVDEITEDEFVERETGEPVTQVIAKMSKSLKNIVNPDDVIRDYGADTFRLYEMYMGPLEASKPWNTRDIIGVYRFLQRVWRLLINEDTGELVLAAEPDEAIERQLHRTIAKVGDDIERLSFNTAIAAMIELVNEALKAGGLAATQAEWFAIALEPFAPHVAEELWSRVGREEPLAYAPWPEPDPALIRDEEIEIPVQIKGKVRGRVRVPADGDQAAVEAIALADPRIQELLSGLTVRKVIVVPGKIVNIIAG
jgi:leucyl-tRNA synthetase